MSRCVCALPCAAFPAGLSLCILHGQGVWAVQANFCTGSDLSTCNYPFPEASAAAAAGPAATAATRGRVFDPNNPPYKINNGNSRRALAVKTLDPDAYHPTGELEYDVHNLYGLAETVSTYKAVTELRPDVRPFILSRSTFVGSGRYGGNPVTARERERETESKRVI
jgi:hypothetical protein